MLRRLPVLVLLLLIGTTGCSAPPELNFLAAVSHIEQDETVDGFPPLVDDEVGGRFAVGVEGPLQDEHTGPRLGGRLAFGVYREDLADRPVAGEPLLTIDEFADLSIITPQLVSSYRVLFGYPEEGAFFVEPGLGAGLAVGVLSFGSDLEFGDQIIGTDIDESQTEVSWALSPFLRLGYAADRLRIGAEGGYQWTGLEFDDGLGADAREWYIGFFFGVQLGE